METAKAALNVWCSKKKLRIDYEIIQTKTNDGKQNFQCDVKIQSINEIVGKGSGQNKKMASNIAAWEALKYLLQQKYINEKELSQPCYEILNIKDELLKSVNDPCPRSNVNYEQNNKFNSNEHHRSNYSSTRENLNRPDHFNDPPPQRGPSTDYSRGGAPPDRYHPPPDRYRGPPPDNFRGPMPNRFRGPPPDHFSGPSSDYYNHPPPPPPNYSGVPSHFPSISDRSRSNNYWGYDVPPDFLNGQQRYNSNNNNYYDNPRNRKMPGIEDENNVTRMRNLNLNYQNNGQNNRSSMVPFSDSEESVNNLFKEPKKRRYDPDSARNKLDQIQNECKFTMDNSKQQLNIFFQLEKIKADYQYHSYGPPHAKTFVARLKFFVHKNRKEYFAEEKGLSKQDASRVCALNILHQLYKDKLIDSFEPEAPSKRQLMKMSLVYIISVKQVLKDYLSQAYNYIISVNQYAEQLKKINPAIDQLPGIPAQMASTYLYWCSPLENFNPWTNSNLDDTYFAKKTKKEIDEQLKYEFTTMIQSHKFKSILSVRMQLPIWRYKQQVIDMIDSNPVVIIKGSTGCGKTTQVSQFILDSYIRSGKGSDCNIIVTQPRRISAISIAERVAYERCEEIRDGRYSVGYSVRFDHVYPRPYGSILFCTTGHLLRRIQGGLKGISHLIIDEVHERDINTDLLLIIIRDLIKVNPNIRVIIMSATLGVSHFQKYFNCYDVMEINSHMFPVTRYYLEDTIELIRWRPRSLSYMEDDVEIIDVNDDYNSKDFDYPKSISQHTIDLLNRLKEGVICTELIIAILEYIHSLTITGSILIFLPGWNSIFGLLNCLKSHHIFGNENKYLLLPLHSQLSHRENNRIFQHTIQRKIILSTNIAETSITIDDVVFVIDTCLIKRKLYCPRTNAQSFVIDWVSKSNIQQRQGRAGRVRSGYFFVLCTKKRYEMLEEFKKPEILVSSLIETSLLIKYLGFSSVSEFLKNALDPPSPKAVHDAIATLISINALNIDQDLTALGMILAKMPIDPRIGRMIIESISLGVASPITTIAAASSINFEIFDNTDLNLLLRTLINLDEERFSDHLIVVKVFSMCEKPDQTQMNSYTCINMNSISVIRNARRQLVNILTKSGFKPELFEIQPAHYYKPEQFDLIAGLLITAFYPNVCMHKDTRRILTNEERIGLIHKTSVFYSYVNNHQLSKSTKLKSPVFIYSEKSQNKNLISSKQMTMVSFLQLLLFGIKSFEFPSSTSNIDANNINNSLVCDTVLLDGWIEIKIEPEIFDYVWQIKAEFEKMIMKLCADPDYIKNELDTTVINAINLLCLFDNVSVEIICK